MGQRGRGALTTALVDPRGGHLEELSDFLDGQEFIVGVYHHDPFAPAANSLALSLFEGERNRSVLRYKATQGNAQTSMSLKRVPKVVWTDTTLLRVPKRVLLGTVIYVISREQARDQVAVLTFQIVCLDTGGFPDIDQMNFLGQKREGENRPPLGSEIKNSRIRARTGSAQQLVSEI